MAGNNWLDLTDGKEDRRMFPWFVAGIHLKETENAVLNVQDAACRNAKTLYFDDRVASTKFGWVNARDAARHGELRIEAPVRF